MTCANHVLPGYYGYDTQITSLPDGGVEVTAPDGGVYQVRGGVERGWVVCAGEPLHVGGRTIGAVTPPD